MTTFDGAAWGAGVRHRGIAARVAGDGPPVMLLHGIGGRADGFRAVAQRLVSAGFRVIAWDAPGYGESDDGPVPANVQGYAAAVVDLLAALDASPAHLAGVSWGGVIATRVAVENPESLRTLTLIDSTRGSGVDADRARAMRDRAAELEVLGAPEFARRRSPRLTRPDADPTVLAEVERHMGTVRLPGYRGAAEMMAGTDHGDLLAAIEIPTLVLVGEHDRVTGVPEARLLARRIPGAAFEIVPRAGHAASQERPELVAGHLAAFMAAAGSRRGRAAR
ncbi:alpha/beta fold hydrolase [Actinomadura macra]|uniref:alpha/beta fold hydrolase n=1 Tax=Actinomadura macra TaxID=46164 RepID=UPI0008378984|nr:alpha/beta hydrolase [Actinomadura macra]